MKPLLYGAVLGLVWLVAGVPLAPALTLLSVLAEPVTVGFILGAAARSYVPGMRRWAR